MDTGIGVGAKVTEISSTTQHWLGPFHRPSVLNDILSGNMTLAIPLNFFIRLIDSRYLPTFVLFFDRTICLIYVLVILI